MGCFAFLFQQASIRIYFLTCTHIESFLLFEHNNHSPTWFLYLFSTAEYLSISGHHLGENGYILIFVCCVVLLNIYYAVKMPLPTSKTSRLWMRIRNMDWWDVVLLHFIVAEWKEEFYIDRTMHLYNTFIQKEELLVWRVICYYAIFYVTCTCAAHFSFGFQSDQAFTCTLNRIRKGINHPCSIQSKFHSESIKVFAWRLFSPIKPSIRLQRG